jgi:hypothetical protein
LLGDTKTKFYFGIMILHQIELLKQDSFTNFNKRKMEYLVNSAIGAAGGWLMGQIGKGGNFGTVGNLVSGVLGGNVGNMALGGALSGLLGGAAADGGAGGIGNWLASAAGSAILTWVSSYIKKG